MLRCRFCPVQIIYYMPDIFNYMSDYVVFALDAYIPKLGSFVHGITVGTGGVDALFCVINYTQEDGRH